MKKIRRYLTSQHLDQEFPLHNNYANHYAKTLSSLESCYSASS